MHRFVALRMTIVQHHIEGPVGNFVKDVLHSGDVVHADHIDETMLVLRHVNDVLLVLPMYNVPHVAKTIDHFDCSLGGDVVTAIVILGELTIEPVIVLRRAMRSKHGSFDSIPRGRVALLKLLAVNGREVA